jgi:hypothetical protein
MDFKEYFTSHNGLGVMSTADNDGRPNSALYARPHVRDDGTLAMVMLGRLTHENLKHNPYAYFLFVEQGAGYKGLRLSLKKIGEERDPQVIAGYRRQPSNGKGAGDKECFVVYFEIEKALQLVGGEPVSPLS